MTSTVPLAKRLLEIQIDHNMSQPEWVYKHWPEYDNETTIEIITKLRQYWRISEFDSPEKARLRGGLLLHDWMTRARSVSLGLPVSPRKMQLYSTVSVSQELYISAFIHQTHKPNLLDAK